MMFFPQDLSMMMSMQPMAASPMMGSTGPASMVQPQMPAAQIQQQLQQMQQQYQQLQQQMQQQQLQQQLQQRQQLFYGPGDIGRPIM
jgi:hypothetical protein